jgi:hypothetical protein
VPLVPAVEVGSVDAVVLKLPLVFSFVVLGLVLERVLPYVESVVEPAAEPDTDPEAVPEVPEVEDGAVVDELVSEGVP